MLNIKIVKIQKSSIKSGGGTNPAPHTHTHTHTYTHTHTHAQNTIIFSTQSVFKYETSARKEPQEQKSTLSICSRL